MIPHLCVGDLCVGSSHDSIKYFERRAIAEKEESRLKGRAAKTTMYAQVGQFEHC